MKCTLILFHVWSFTAIAQTSTDSYVDPTFSQSEVPEPFRDNLFGVTVNRNFPLGFTRETYAPSGRQNFSASYRRTLSASWLSGVQFGFKSLEFKEKPGALNMLVLTHEIYRLVRVYHPWYLGAGYRVQYLAPVVEQTIPTERLSEVNAEVGVAASLLLITRISTHFVALSYLDRWRGTNTNELHGFEFGFGLAYDVDDSLF